MTELQNLNTPNPSEVTYTYASNCGNAGTKYKSLKPNFEWDNASTENQQSSHWVKIVKQCENSRPGKKQPSAAPKV
jgi:K+-transporting ATPase A subunit